MCAEVAAGGDALNVTPNRQTIEQQGPEAKPVLHLEEILLCTDFSVPSEAACEVAMRLSRPTKAHITVLHVCEFGPMGASTDEGLNYVDRLYADRRRSADELVNGLRSRGFRADAVVLDGNAPTIILEQIRWSRADLVVLGTRGIRGLERLVFGSTAEAVFRKAGCPVVTVGAHCCAAANDATQAGPVIFATEFQQGAQPSIEFATALANTYGVPLHCLHVLPSLPKTAQNPAVESIIMDGLKRLTSDGCACNVTPICNVLYGSDVSHAVVEYARATNAQAVVLGVRRKLRVAWHLPPQRTYRIMMTAPCPVFTISEH